MHNKYKTATIGNETATIYYEEQPESPREWDNLGTMICFHSRYNLGDKHGFTKEELIEYINRKDVIALPLYLYDHSGLRIYTANGLRSSHWDTSMVGYMVVDYDTIRQNYNRQRITTKLRLDVIKCLKGEIETYDLYLRGEVFGFEINKHEICPCCKQEITDNIESVWGFYGTDFENNVIYEYMGEKWKDAEWIDPDDE